MPKTLRLKKVQQNVTVKSQKAITEFFKASVSNDNQSVAVSNLDVKNDKQETRTGKRKASCIEIHRKSSSCDPINSYEDMVSPKKLKTSTIKLKTLQLKENACNLNLSPDKYSSDEKIHGQILEKSLEVESSIYKVTLSDITGGTNNSLCVSKLSSQMEFNYDDTPAIEQSSIQSLSPSKKTHSPRRKHRTPNKSPFQEFSCLPVTKLVTPEKSLKDVISPSKCGSTVKVLDFFQDEVDVFADEWSVEEVIEDCSEDVDFSQIQRCEILSVQNYHNRIKLRLKNSKGNCGSCFVEGIWLDTPLSPGDIVSVVAACNSSGEFIVSDSSGLLVLRPDHLVSSTSVVGAVFCKRKAILQERWRGIDSANTAMTIGILVHELVQKALTQNILEVEQLRSEMDMIIEESVKMLYDANISKEEARDNMQKYIVSLANFMQTYVAPKPSIHATEKNKQKWNGHIDKVLDIEENLCCPQLGLKGKIDATLQVTVNNSKDSESCVVPLELKSGKASASAEHRGQLVLYGMMLGGGPTPSLRPSSPSRPPPLSRPPPGGAQRGLLLYLRDGVDLSEVSCGHPERRDLIMLRNQLVEHLAPGPRDINHEQVVDIEEAAASVAQRLPGPVRRAACAACPYLTLCSLHLWHTDGPSVSETHPLSQLREVALSHLSADHIQYFLRWTALLRIEERVQMTSSPLHALWTESIEKRVKRGTCISNLKLKSVEPLGDRFLHKFDKRNNNVNDKKGPQEGEYSIVSIESRPWIAAGVICSVNGKELHIVLERDLRQRLNNDTEYHIDTYESYAATVQNLTNLGVLMEDSDRAQRLRRVVIERAAPRFSASLPRAVERAGRATRLRALNEQQQRGVLRALAARDYALLQGLPGTGKTQTVSVLIQMLVALQQRVLVTAHTHSAVDTVLTRLPESIHVMRLGSSARVVSSLLGRTEEKLTADCKSPEELSEVYDSMEVVGVTCLGAAHAMLARTTFDVCIVDEATQVLQCTVLRPLFAANKFILVGDPEQLPPVIKSRAARRLGMEESLFHRLMSEDATSTLQLQYRMNKALADLANKVAYNDRLKCANETVANAKINIDIIKLSSKEQWLQTACSPESQHAALFLDVRCGNVNSDVKSCENVGEACFVLALVEALIEGGVKPIDIGCIAPYRDQVALLRRNVSRHAVEVSTVDQFQGRDKSVIIYSCTKREDGRDDTNFKEGEILNDQRRLAVSVTRAKHKLIVLGNTRVLKRYESLQRLIQSCTLLQVDQNVINHVMTKYRTLLV